MDGRGFLPLFLRAAHDRGREEGFKGDDAVGEVVRIVVEL
jgi:hypothetical protein